MFTSLSISLFLLRWRCSVVQLSCILSLHLRSLWQRIFCVHAVTSVARITSYVASIVLSVVISAVTVIHRLTVSISTAWCGVLPWVSPHLVSVAHVAHITSAVAVTHVARITSWPAWVWPEIAHIPLVSLISWRIVPRRLVPWRLIPSYSIIPLPWLIPLVPLIAHWRSAVMHLVILRPAVKVPVQGPLPLEWTAAC